MNKQQWQNRIEELEKELAKLKAKPPKREPGERWKPEDGEKYWVIDRDDEPDHYMWDDDSFDYAKLDKFNVFRTKEEAEFARERTKVMRELDLWAVDGLLELNGIYGIFCDYIGEVGVFLCTYKCSPHIFESREVAEKAIKAIGEERLKKYYFRVVE